MVIRSLSLQNYRNYQSLQVDFNSGLNFVFGKNGQGKTNLIESLYFATHLKSFRTHRLEVLPCYETEEAVIRATILKQSVTNNVAISLIKDRKKVFLNDKSLAFTSEYIRNFFSILFAPDLLSAFKEYPLERRTFFDRILFLTDTGYFQAYREFNRIRKQKSVVLKHHNQKELDVWNRMLADIIPQINQARFDLITDINGLLTDYYQKLTGRKEDLKLCYRNDFSDKIPNNQEAIFEYLTSKKEMEIAKGYVIYGPHKDQYWMTREGKADRYTFSQGEYRISFLALQLTVNHIIKQKLDFHPILLLDDIFSELDEGVCARTIEHIFENSNQVFITSTVIPEVFLKLGKSYQIETGKIINK